MAYTEPGGSMHPQETVGHAIRTRRLQVGFSQEELAVRAGLHRTYVGSVERGERNISLMNLTKMATALGVRVRDLVDGL
jgi:transcriptional regulator with XRE-family HTH domain